MQWIYCTLRNSSVLLYSREVFKSTVQIDRIGWKMESICRKATGKRVYYLSLGCWKIASELQEDVMLFVHSNILVQLTAIILLKTEVKASIRQYEKLCMQSHAYLFCKKLTQLKTCHTAALFSWNLTRIIITLLNVCCFWSIMILVLSWCLWTGSIHIWCWPKCCDVCTWPRSGSASAATSAFSIPSFAWCWTFKVHISTKFWVHYSAPVYVLIKAHCSTLLL